MALINPKHMILLIIILVVSDLLIGVYGHYTGTGEESFEDYITDPDTVNELILIFIFALAIVAIIHFVFKI